jgi:hypothetical protein
MGTNCSSFQIRFPATQSLWQREGKESQSPTSHAWGVSTTLSLQRCWVWRNHIIDGMMITIVNDSVIHILCRDCTFSKELRVLRQWTFTVSLYEWKHQSDGILNKKPTWNDLQTTNMGVRFEACMEFLDDFWRECEWRENNVNTDHMNPDVWWWC